MRNYIKISTIILLIFTLFSSCSKDSKSGKIVNVEIDGKPASLDPQLAKNDTEYLISRNIFEGLLRVDENGEIQPACAEKYEIDGLKYTFTLRKNLKWQNGDPLTAADFQFGIRRSILNETKSPNAEKLYSIKNAQKIHEGALQIGELAVAAPDDYTVIIELSAPDYEFEYKLTSAAAMPCNQEFFESTKGRYGLSADNILCNGAFYARRWEAAEYVSLRKNPEYSTRNVRPSNAVIYFARDTEYRALRLDDGRCDLAFGGSSMSEALVQYDVEPNLIFNTTIMLALNPERAFTGHSGIREAFVESLRLRENIPGFLMEAAAPVPPGLFVRGFLYRHSSKINAERVFDPDSAKQKFIDTIAREKLTDTTIELRYYNTPGLEDLAKSIAQGWQQTFGIVVNMSTIEPSQLMNFLANKEYTAALIPFSAAEGSAKAFLAELCRESTEYLIKGADIHKFLNQITANISDEEYISIIESAETELLRLSTLTPLIYDGICFGAANKIEGASFSLTEGYIDLAPIGKDN